MYLRNPGTLKCLHNFSVILAQTADPLLPVLIADKTLRYRPVQTTGFHLRRVHSNINWHTVEQRSLTTKLENMVNKNV